MSLGKNLGFTFTLLAALYSASCSGGGSSGGSGSANDLVSALQDLDLDGQGTVTVLTFESATGLSGAATGNFSASGGQTPTGVTVDENTITVTWDEYVSPAHTISVSGLSGVAGSAVAVSTSDTSVPTFIATGAQNPGWGNDVVTVTFSGVNVAEDSAENIANWVLTVNGSTLPLTGTVIDLDPLTQVMTMELGNSAALWSSFSLRSSGVRGVNHVALATTNVSGAASGDTSAPTLTSARQDLGADPLGRVVEFQFSEAMSPNFSGQLSQYGVSTPDVAVSVSQTHSNRISVTFNNPMVPGLDEVELDGLRDAHGNALATTTAAITQPSPVVNALSGTPTANTVENAGGDYLSFTTTQAFDPDSALDPANWTLLVDGAPIDLSSQTFEYDITTRTTTITLDFDLANGDDFVLTAATVVDVDGQLTALSSGTQSIGGDSAAPALSTAIQNRTIDSSGATVDITFSEDVEGTSAENTANYAVVGGAQTVSSATLQANNRTVRVVCDAAMVPGLHNLQVSNVTDLAGNAMSAPATVGMSSTDTSAPTMTSTSANAIAGLANDTLVVNFSDDMYAEGIEDSSNWVLESPIGSGITLGVCGVTYVDIQRRATLTLDGSTVNLQQGADYQISFSGGVDLGGNTISATPSTGVVNAESVLPEMTLAYVVSAPTTSVTLVFSEPCGNLTDLYNAVSNPDGVRYTLHNGNTVSAASATASSDQLSVTVTFAGQATIASTVDVFGVRDMAGNPMFPVSGASIVDGTGQLGAPASISAVATAVQGEENDTIVITFDRNMNPFGLEDMNNYSVDVSMGTSTIGLFRTSFDFNGTNQVTLTLEDDMAAYNLQNGDQIDVTVDNVFSRFGTPNALTLAQTGVLVGGDSLNQISGTNPTVRFDPANAQALLVTFPEAMDGEAGSFQLNGVTVASSIAQLSPRVVRATFASAPIVGDTLDIVVDDLAGNSGSAATLAIAAADSSAPGAAIAAAQVSGFGGDTLTITYTEPVTVSNSTITSSYTLTANGSSLSLAGSTVRYSSIDNSVRFTLASGQEFPNASAVSLTITGVTDHAGNSLSGILLSTSSGDSSAPTMVSAFANYAADASGAMVDVLFDEDVNVTRAEDETNWSTTGTATVVFVERVSAKHYRVTLSEALAAGDSLRANTMRDATGNQSGLLSVNPVE
jgi:hypothetical protein